ncbi:Putative flippase GtrA (transmembrane translocase of bactoprenol-linked glucose) [Sporobacter termitidis DSM 10068]|uniref:Putative flippase GtrA (Transmembrane translocase of bactoprenol-linked glucose) n=1 Tax=Sporobacter termitidis DSM 10068 TaxID=1123282 RepID=A0A1M5VPF7_9FIRM|nr:GtrA family protein [Sporobacter termitidis]SHH76803.1 Putative flippase GtrA (transmembrane translocase of bactoprenol-linked glucose) [Sporobacter termitidis DSM 10068]
MIRTIRTTLQKTIEFLKSPRGETLRYVIIGGCTTLVDYFSYQMMIAFLHMSVTASNAVSTALAILFAYITNKLVVFFSRTVGLAGLALELARFLASRLFTMVLEFAGVYLLVNILGQDYRLGKAETIVLVVIVNYVLSKLFVFRKDQPQ